jgi:hypothetical protein
MSTTGTEGTGQRPRWRRRRKRSPAVRRPHRQPAAAAAYAPCGRPSAARLCAAAVRGAAGDRDESGRPLLAARQCAIQPSLAPAPLRVREPPRPLRVGRPAAHKRRPRRIRPAPLALGQPQLYPHLGAQRKAAGPEELTPERLQRALGRLPRRQRYNRQRQRRRRRDAALCSMQGVQKVLRSQGLVYILDTLQHPQKPDQPL